MHSAETTPFDATTPASSRLTGSASSPLVPLGEGSLRQACGRRNRPAVLVPALLATGAVGYGLAWGAGRFGNLAPLVLAGLVILLAVLLLVASRPVVAVAGVFLLFPIGTRTIMGPLDVIGLAIGTVAVLVLLTRRLGVSRRRLPAPVWWLAAFFGWALLAVPSALDKTLAVREMGILLLALVFLVVVISVCSRHDDVRWVMTAFLGLMVVGTASSAVGMGHVQAAYGASVVEGRALGFIGEPNSFGTLCMMAGLLAFALALGGARGRWRVVAAVVGLVVVTGLLLSFSRGAWIGFTIGLAVLAGSLHQARRALVFCALALVALAVGLATVIPQPPQVEVAGERLRSIVGEKNPYDDRPQIWAEARREIVEQPLFGQGPGNFPEASRRSTSQGRTAFAFHAHNLLLTWGAEAGLPALAILVGLSLHVTRLARRARRHAAADGRPQDAALLTGLSAAMAAVAGQGLVDYNLRNSVVLVAVMAILGLLLAGIRAETEA